MLNLIFNFENFRTIPENYRVLFVHGGGTAQFASVPLNLCTELKKEKVNYVITGTWSEKAAWEAEKYCLVNRVTPKIPINKINSIPDVSEWTVNSVAYIYLTQNVQPFPMSMFT